MTLFAESDKYGLASPAILWSEYVAKDGTVQRSSLDLDRLIGNDNGTLIWMDVGFSGTSKEINLRSSGLLCAMCRDRNGAYLYSSIDLNAFITGVGGILEVEVDWSLRVFAYFPWIGCWGNRTFFVSWVEEQSPKWNRQSFRKPTFLITKTLNGHAMERGQYHPHHHQQQP
ncbi:Cyanovirin-N [Cantharellus anzutake]|uniref:Cyanovirin-N n=1 Tax=Cantharellus anzutake TaxID=1750568 RepID=UPI001903B96B|nr:Cyanovirin-N [Cantharellus anzutake]KAF8325209.1 Cyanovirin-N [Cantharellus anzutake]